MTNITNVLNELADISQQIKTKEPPAITLPEKQAAIVMASLETEIINLMIEQNMSIEIIFRSLFYFWLTLEAPLCGVRKRLNSLSVSLEETTNRIIEVIKITLETLPCYQPTAEMEKLGVRINMIKSLIPDTELECNLTHDEVVKQATIINTRIHTVTSDFLKQSFHPGIVANVLFGNWLRISTMSKHVPENYYQKIEYYFEDIRKAVRAYIPTLFK